MSLALEPRAEVPRGGVSRELGASLAVRESRQKGESAVAEFSQECLFIDREFQDTLS